MLSFESEFTIPSKLKDEKGQLLYPGVSFTVKRLSSVARANRDLECGDALDELEVMRRQFAALPEKSEDDTPEQAQERAKVTSKFNRIQQAKVAPVVIRAGLIKMDGVAGTIEDFLDRGDEALIDEAYVLCEAAAKMSAEQLKNLASPGTSTTAAAGQSETSNVLIAAA